MRSVVILLLVALAPVLAKSFKHPSGFKFELPNGWNTENGPNAAVLLPPGVKLDPSREDNPEVYTVYGEQEESTVEVLKGNLSNLGVKVDMGKPEVLRQPQRIGSINSYEFTHPQKKTAMRVLIYEITVKGRHITLVAMGLRERVSAREKDLRGIALSLDYDK